MRFFGARPTRDKVEDASPIVIMKGIDSLFVRALGDQTSSDDRKIASLDRPRSI